MKIWFKTLINKFLPENSAVRSVSVLVSGTAIAQLLNIITMPFISRLYTPSDFGVFALFASILSILVEVSGLRYHFAIPLSRENRIAKSLVLLSFSLQLLFCSLLFLLFSFYRQTIFPFFSLQMLLPYWYLVPIGVLGIGSYLILTQWAVRSQEFPLLARTRLTQSIWGIVTKIVLGVAGVKPLGLLLGNIASQAGGITSLSTKLLKKEGFPNFRVRDIKYVAIKYKKFPLFNTWSGLLNTIGRQITPILLTSFFSTEIAGWFAMGSQLLQLPAAFIGQAVAQVFYRRASIAFYEERLAQVTMVTFKLLFILGCFPILLICTLAPEIFRVVLGEQWITAGIFSRYLGPWIVVVFAYSPISGLFSILNLQDRALLYEILFTICRISALYIGFISGNYLIAIASFGFVSFLFPFFAIVWLVLKTGNDWGTLFKFLFRVLSFCFLLLSPTVWALCFDFNILRVFFISCISFLFYLYIIVFYVKKSF